jgi:tetratricopeptide (TPR) repeat protein
MSRSANEFRVIIVSGDDKRSPQPLRFSATFQASFQQPVVWHRQPQPQRQALDAASIEAKLQHALRLHQQGRLIDAERVYREILQHAPAHFDALHLLGVLALQTGRTESGVELIANAVALNPNSWGAHNNLGNGLRELGRLDAALGSFDRSIALRPDFAEAHNNRGIVLQNLRRFDDALASFETAIALKPDYAEAHNNRGVALQELKRLVDARASFDAAIALKHDYAEACNNRGNVGKQLGDLARAIADFDNAIALRPDYAAAHYNRGTVLQESRRFDDALVSLERAIALQPDHAEAYNNRGLVLQELGRPDEAIASFDRTIGLKPNDAEAYVNKSFSLLQLGRFEQGWRLYEWRKKLAQPFGDRSFAKPLWLGSADIANRTVFVHWEQGLGDTIQYARFAQLLSGRGANVVMSVQEPLFRLFKQTSSDVQVIDQDEVPAAFDCHCPLMSLPLALGTTLQSIPAKQPYLFADASLRDAWNARLPPKTKPRIGIVWSGGAKHKNDAQRSIDLSTFASVLSSDVLWISLQKELRESDAAALRQLHHIARYGEELQDFSDTAALIDLLDLVIAVDTSVAHLAGAMGKEVWLLLPYHADWRWLLDRGDSPWYPTARLFRQDSARSWRNVLARLRGALDEFVRSHS